MVSSIIPDRYHTWCYDLIAVYRPILFTYYFYLFIYFLIYIIDCSIY